MEDYDIIVKFIINDMAANEDEAEELMDIAEMLGYI